MQDDIITYTTNDGKAHEYDVPEFLALLSCHIPKPYESMTRYYGYYSCRKRGERRKQQQRQQAQHQDPLLHIYEPRRKPSLTWAACMKRIFEFDPLECPICKGEMRIISFITEEREVLRIADALGIPRAHSPPKIPKAREPEYFDEIPPDEFS